MKTRIIVGGMLAAIAVAATAEADVLYSNFGPDDTYALNIGAALSYGGPLGGQVNEAAVPFTVTGGDYYFDSAEVAILHSWGPDLVYADLRNDDNGAPGAVLETTSGSGVTNPFTWAPPMELAFSGGLLLEEGQQYWLALRTEETDALLSWAHNVVDDFGLRAWRMDGGPWNTAFGTPGTDSQRSVFRINATPVPGPGALALLGVAGLLCRRRRA